MIREKTVVVVAAGASHDVGFPLGPDLQKRVAQMLADGGEMYSILTYAAGKMLGEGQGDRAKNVYDRARSIRSQLVSAASIDNFLDQHKNETDLVRFIKLTIAYAIAQAEKKSKLAGWDNHSAIIEGTKNYFLFDLMNIVVRGHQGENIGGSLKNLTFIIYNYDRCVERYIDIWLLYRFGFSLSDCSERPNFIHVYGSLGNYFDAGVFNPFEYDGRYVFPSPHKALPTYADSIKVFTEQEDSETDREITKSVGESRNIVFLGFGFEEQNMRFFDSRWADKNVFATVFGLSEQNKAFIEKSLVYRFSAKQRAVNTINGKSKDLFSDFYHPITAAVKSL